MIGNKIYFAKTRPTAKIPTKRDEDGCYDLYCCFADGNDSLVIDPFQTILIPTGIASAFSSDYRVSVRERGSTGVVNLQVNAGQIDSGFRGEWFVALHNANDIPVEITKSISKVERSGDFIRYPYEKAIAQCAVELVPVMEVEEKDWESLFAIKSERGTGQIGSSGK